MYRLKKAVLVGSKFLEFCVEKLTLMVGNRLLVEYKNARDIIIMNLANLVKMYTDIVFKTNLLFQIF